MCQYVPQFNCWNSTVLDDVWIFLYYIIPGGKHTWTLSQYYVFTRTKCISMALSSQAMVSAMDEAISNITGALQDQGLWEDTLLVFTTDVSDWVQIERRENQQTFRDKSYMERGYVYSLSRSCPKIVWETRLIPCGQWNFDRFEYLSFNGITYRCHRCKTVRFLICVFLITVSRIPTA